MSDATLSKPHADAPSRPAVSDAARKRALKRLRGLLPESCLLTQAAALKPYETDGLTALREIPWVVALPETEAAVAGVLEICREEGIPVVPRGAGTGLSGGARPLADGVLLGLSKLDRILEIDIPNRAARVQPGVRNLAISEAVTGDGFYYAPDPSSQIACSIGGNVAENSGGVHCLKYGLTVHNVLGLTVLTFAGDRLVIGGPGGDPECLDLLALFCGSEGLLGVITEIWVRLLPTPPERRVLLGAFPSVAGAADAVAGIIGSGLIPAGLEMMDALAVKAAEAFVRAGYPTDAGAVLLCELDGVTEEVAADAARVAEVFRAFGAEQVQVAETEAEQARLWLGRKAAFPAVGRLAPDYYCMDGTIPRAKLAAVLGRISELSERYGLAVANVFHAGDGNLHPLILYDANAPGELEKAEAFGEEILNLCVAVGGTVTGEHGVGVEKLAPMCHQFDEAELAQFFRLREAFDPEGLMNPGKAIPTLARCAEIGGMHVHAARPPFPNLDRF